MSELISSVPNIAYLGPRGTFTEQALHTQEDLAEWTHTRFGSIVEVLNSVEAGKVDYGFAAIENMIEGSVNATIDALAFDTQLLIQREVVININLNLLVRPGVGLEDIKRVRSYPIAYAQCRRYLSKHLPHATIEATNSTADAARELSSGGLWGLGGSGNLGSSGSSDGSGDPGGSGGSGDSQGWRATAAIAPQRAADVYGLEVLAADIEDHPDNQTRFVLVAKNRISPPSGNDKTSIAIFQRDDQPGSLISILQEFAARRINLTKLASRPTRKALGDYCFLIDCEGHIASEVLGDALRSLHQQGHEVKFLGSYPSAYGSSVAQASGREDSEADRWLEELRSGIGRQA